MFCGTFLSAVLYPPISFIFSIGNLFTGISFSIVLFPETSFETTSFETVSFDAVSFLATSFVVVFPELLCVM